MKKILLFLCCLLAFAMTPPTQQSKRVYVTLDVSGSMTGDKYVLANYTTQMIVTLCDDDDEVYMILYGKEKCLSKEKKPLEVIQKPMGVLNWGKQKPESQFGDIMGFNGVYSPSKNKQDWLFIIGDGYWGTTSTPDYAKDCELFGKTVKEGHLNICYLQTCHKLDEHTDFTVFAETLGVVDIGKSDITPPTIINGCDHFAKKILGFSEVSLKKKKEGKQCLSFKAELPIKEFVLVYQDQVEPNLLPNINNATADGTNLKVKLKGTPTTIPVKTQPWEATLSGNVWRVNSNKAIPANTKIKVCFDKAINLDKVSIYPVVKNVEFGGTCMAPVDTKMKKLNDNTFSICRDEKTAKVRVELTKESKENLPEELLKKTTVVVKANNKEYKAKYKDGGFECDIEIINEETQYYAECDCPGYFKRVTPITTIVKGDCKKAKKEMTVTEKTPLDLPSMTFQQLKDNSIRGRLIDESSKQTLDPERFHISIEVENEFLYEKPTIRFDGDTIVLDLHPKGKWCECLFPDSVKIKVVSTPKDGAFNDEGKQYSQTDHPMRFKLEKDRSWFSRCLWVLVTLAALLAFTFYLRALLKKNRFHKNARLKNSYVVDGSPKETQKNGRPMREDGFGPWFNRWFNPFVDEKNTIKFTRPKTPTMTFTASESKNKILLSEACFDTKKMTIPGYTPPPKDQDKKTTTTGKPIGISAGTAIEIKTTQGSTASRLGHVTYFVEGKDDIGGYRFFIGLLMILSILTFIVLTFMLIKGIR